MKNIVIKLTDGSQQEFTATRHVYDNKLNLIIDGGFIVITDQWGNKEIFPENVVAHVSITND